MSKYVDKHYKYIHIFFHDDIKFNPYVVYMVNDPMAGFNPDEHYFLTSKQKVYEEIKGYKNTALYDYIEPCEIINEVAPFCDWLIIHAIPTAWDMIRINPEYINKLVLRSWGHDISREIYHHFQPIKNIYKLIIKLKKRWKETIRKARIITGDNVTDIINIKNVFGENVRTMATQYPTDITEQQLDEDRKTEKKHDKNITYVMVGHSGMKVNNHIKILKMLEKWQNENIKIFIPLSYVHKPYENKIKKYVAKRWKNNKAEIVQKFIPYKEYVRFIKEMDIMIFDGKISYALGNIKLGVFFKNKFFLNEKGVIYQGFNETANPVTPTSKLNKMSYKEFISPVTYPNFENNGMRVHGKEYCFNEWKELFYKLDNEKIQ
ncbi:MAG: TDP-N-acetylfucosamine:lipid II N-acetylfucosaminyltransferase [Clostridia bacterium]|nr:TDP-N-acetylfucosamine:lipid II N-acetylfucosaminyltransferase [Clostridia bacterium]